MSDARLRQLERRWWQTGAVEDEAAYLAERVRVGDLDLEMLKIAGEIPYPAALLACRNIIFIRFQPGFFAPHGHNRESRLRIALCIASSTLKILGNTLQNFDVFQESLDDITDWLLFSDSVDIEAIQDIARFCKQEAHPFLSAMEAESVYCSTAIVIARTAQMTFVELDRIEYYTLDVFKHARIALSRHGIPREEINENIRQSLLREIAPWALGYGDPLRESLEQNPPRTE